MHPSNQKACLAALGFLMCIVDLEIEKHVQISSRAVIMQYKKPINQKIATAFAPLHNPHSQS